MRGLSFLYHENLSPPSSSRSDEGKERAVLAVVRSDGGWWLVAGVTVLVVYNVGVGGGGISRRLSGNIFGLPFLSAAPFLRPVFGGGCNGFGGGPLGGGGGGRGG
ncbi:hypothetical protein HanIR_Chr14g0674821 [Helianthus annuus]|nr:hypothetical protein HanIR_Chr14g0674821 [Helianthus annuus]